MTPLHQHIDSAISIAVPKTNPPHSNSLAMSTNGSSPQADLAAELPPRASSTVPQSQRLEAARSRINTACAERNYFSPTFQIAPCDPSQAQHPPNPEQLERDLQTMFKRFLALDSTQADGVYEDMAVEVGDMANNEFLRFDWEVFQEAVGRRVRMLRERGEVVEVRDLGSLGGVRTYL